MSIRKDSKLQSAEERQAADYEVTRDEKDSDEDTEEDRTDLP
jgi:hypothetical protein